MNLVGAVVGLVVGAAVAALWGLRRTAALRDELAVARGRAEVAEALHRSSQETLERERDAHREAMSGMESFFEATSSRVLASSMSQFNETQERILRERDSKLKDSLAPLEDLLGQYKISLEGFDRSHRQALSDVQSRANDLLTAQQRTQEETARLNQLLGRSADRGRWGEIQLENVLRASGLRATIDYELQATHAGSEGQRQRPDCVVHLPNNAKVVVDAKFPFANFERAIASSDPVERRVFEERSAADLREHVKALSGKAYFEALDYSPEFTVCFVPSDAALVAAYEADPSLHAFAAEKRVLLAGPTNLLSLLWSVAEVVKRHAFANNAQAILSTATELYNKVRLVAEPLTRLGKSLNDTVGHYNAAIASMESRLIPMARRIRNLEGATGAKDIDDIKPLTVSARALDTPKWGVDPDDPSLGEQSEILDLEDADEERGPAVD
jgi:DNA recombination protein RmuC